MNTYYACFENPYGYKGVSNILIPMLCNVMSAKHVRLNVCRTCTLIWLLLVNMTCVVVLFLFLLWFNFHLFFMLAY
jgi:hypothetical protein